MTDALTIRLLDREVVLRRDSEHSYGTQHGQFSLTRFNSRSVYGAVWLAQAFDVGVWRVHATGSTWNRAVASLDEKLRQLQQQGRLRANLSRERNPVVSETTICTPALESGTACARLGGDGRLR